MPLTLIENQPLRFSNTKETDSDCVTERNTYCQLYQTGDRIMAQWRNVLCDDTNLLCNPDFTNASAELVSNGDFASNADWTFGDWTYDGTNDRAQSSGTFVNPLVQSTLGVTNGVGYIVQFTVIGSTQGSVTVNLAGTSGTQRVGNGIFTEYLTAGASDNISFIGANGFDGAIDDVSVLPVSLTCTTYNPTEWEIIDGEARHITGNTGTVDMEVSVGLFSGFWYRVTFTVSGMTAGTLDVEIGQEAIGTASANGIFVYYGGDVMADDLLSFIPSTDFDGTISAIELVRMENGYSVHLLDSETGAYAYDLTGSVQYKRDYVVLNASTLSIPEGCYTVCIYDACGYNVNTELFTDGSFNDAGQWSLNNTWINNTSSVSGGKLTMGVVTSHAYNEWRITNSAIYPIGAEILRIDWTFTTGVWDQPASVYLTDKMGAYHLLKANCAASTTYSGTITLTGQNAVGGINVGFRVYLAPATSGTTLELTNISYIMQAYVPGEMEEYCSNCITIKDEIPCSKYIFAYNNEDGFGFTFFNDGVRQQGLGARLRCLFKNPRYDGQNERYLGSDGTYRKSFASTEKKWDLKFDYVDEWTHDYIRVMLQCDYLQIGDAPYQGEFYSCVDDDYTPEWVDEITNIAQSTVEVQRATSVLFNNNAGF